MRHLENSLMAKKISIIGKRIAPQMMNFVPEFGGLTKLESIPGGGEATGISASCAADKFSKDDIF